MSSGLTRFPTPTEAPPSNEGRATRGHAARPGTGDMSRASPHPCTRPGRCYHAKIYVKPGSPGVNPKTPIPILHQTLHPVHRHATDLGPSPHPYLHPTPHPRQRYFQSMTRPSLHASLGRKKGPGCDGERWPRTRRARAWLQRAGGGRRGSPCWRDKRRAVHAETDICWSMGEAGGANRRKRLVRSHTQCRSRTRGREPGNRGRPACPGCELAAPQAPLARTLLPCRLQRHRRPFLPPRAPTCCPSSPALCVRVSGRREFGLCAGFWDSARLQAGLCHKRDQNLSARDLVGW